MKKMENELIIKHINNYQIRHARDASLTDIALCTCAFLARQPNMMGDIAVAPQVKPE